jgi:selenocysteine lyase/cysteine desulfurase
MTIDIDKARLDTPSSQRMIHFNNAGSSLSPTPVVQAVASHLALEQEVGGYEAEAQAKDVLAGFYTGFASLLGAGADEIAYVENATRAWDMAFYGLPLDEGDRILTHEAEYASNYLALLQQAKRKGLHVDLVPSDSFGQIDVEAMERMIRPETKLIALTHVPTQGGLVNPAKDVGRVAKAYGLIYMLDACQSVGQMPVNVADIGCDILSGTGRKFLRGPRGTGFLYVSNKIIERLEPPFIDLHAATWTGPDTYVLADGAKRFENYESYVAGRVGLAHAVSYAMEIGLEAIEARILSLAERLRTCLAELPNVTVHDRGKHLCGIVTFKVENEAPAETARRLAEKKMNVSVSVRRYAQLDFGTRDIDALTRASVHYYNTIDEVDRFVAAVSEAG